MFFSTFVSSTCLSLRCFWMAFLIRQSPFLLFCSPYSMVLFAWTTFLTFKGKICSAVNSFFRYDLSGVS